MRLALSSYVCIGHSYQVHMILPLVCVLGFHKPLSVVLISSNISDVYNIYNVQVQRQMMLTSLCPSLRWASALLDLTSPTEHTRYNNYTPYQCSGHKPFPVQLLMCIKIRWIFTWCLLCEVNTAKVCYITCKIIIIMAV